MNQKEKAEAIKRQLVIINKLLKKPENKYCADCKRTSPSWANINLGVFVCINCSGCHREIGVHVTKIKSVNLDVWSEDTLKYFQKINNEIANEYWEYKLKNFDFWGITFYLNYYIIFLIFPIIYNGILISHSSSL